MLITFVILLTIGIYKIYILFNQPTDGPDTKTEHDELKDIIIVFIQNNSLSNIDNESLFEQILAKADFDKEKYTNFNLNRFNQLIQQLFYLYEVDSLDELMESIRAQNTKE